MRQQLRACYHKLTKEQKKSFRAFVELPDKEYRRSTRELDSEWQDLLRLERMLGQ